ncbi:MAG: nitrogen fixation protein NifM [Gammaproteobacteria bacterium]
MPEAPPPESSPASHPRAEDSPIWRYHLLRAALNLYQRGPGDLNGEERQQADSMARRSVMLESLALSSDEARAMPLPERQIDQALAEVRGQYEAEDDFLADLARNGLDTAGMREALDRELRFNAVMDRVSARSAKINDLDVQLYYQLHRDRFSRPEQRTARQILITINDDFAENTRAAALSRAEAIATRLQKKPKRFEEQAYKHSECPTATQGGLLGTVKQGTLFPELDAVLFQMKAGEVSDVIETELGFHVLYCEAITPEGAPSYGEVADAIRERLAERQRKICQRAWLSSLAQANADAAAGQAPEDGEPGDTLKDMKAAGHA